ncbi:MAG: hypothetical protein ACTSYD_03870 [Candidatus Heimdallarchaeaceae archaeon]
MRLSSKLALLVCIIGFLSTFMPALYVEKSAWTWIDLHESPPLWFYLIASFIVAAHDMEFFQGIPFIYKSNTRIVRVLLLIVALLMAYALELSVNVSITGDTYWRYSILFRLPPDLDILQGIAIGYHLIRTCRIILLFATLEALIEKDTKKIYVHREDIIREQVFKEPLQ